MNRRILIALSILCCLSAGCAAQKELSVEQEQERQQISVTLTELPQATGIEAIPTAAAAKIGLVAAEVELGLPYEGGLKLYDICVGTDKLTAELWRDGMSVYSREKTLSDAERTELLSLLSPVLTEERWCAELPYAETGYFSATVSWSDGTVENYGAETGVLPMELHSFLEQVEAWTEDYEEV